MLKRDAFCLICGKDYVLVPAGGEHAPKSVEPAVPILGDCCEETEAGKRYKELVWGILGKKAL